MGMLHLEILGTMSTKVTLIHGKKEDQEVHLLGHEVTDIEITAVGTVNHHVQSEIELKEIEIVIEIVIIDTLNKEIEIVKEVKKETKIEIEMMKGDQREKGVIAVKES